MKTAASGSPKQLLKNASDVDGDELFISDLKLSKGKGHSVQTQMAHGHLSQAKTGVGKLNLAIKPMMSKYTIYYSCEPVRPSSQ